MTRLHLGCGEIYLDGYENIDFPLAQHTVQRASVADRFADIRELRYPAASVDEVRLRHVFEHFTRATAAALLLSWRSWLKVGGLVHIELPDFDKTARRALSRFGGVRNRQVALRHIFGSQEATWAVHQHGWSPRQLRDIAERFALDVTKVEHERYRGTFNCTLLAVRNSVEITHQQALSLITDYLADFTLDASEAERRLLDVWIEEARRQLAATWAS